MTAPRLRLEQRSKQVPARLAVEARSLDEPGEIYGLIGPNGSGGSPAFAHRRLKTLETA